MARPEKNNADYFSHDSNMRNDPKVKALRRKFKDGYSVYNMLLEALTDSEFFTIELTPITVELLAGDFDIEPELLEQIIEYSVKIDLLKQEENKIYSSGLKKRLQPVIDKRNTAKERFLKQKEEVKGVSVTETTQSKVKESKVNNTDIKSVLNVVVEENAKPVFEEEKIENQEPPAAVNTEENFSEKKDVAAGPVSLVDEEEYAAALEHLKTTSYFLLVQQHRGKAPEEVETLFRTYYEQKSGFQEIAGKTPGDVMKNFYFWTNKFLAGTPVKAINKPFKNQQSTVPKADAALDVHQQYLQQLENQQ